MSEHDDEVRGAIAGRRPNQGGWIRCDCPFCASEVGKEDTSACLAVHATLGFFKCWRCGTKGRLDGYEDEVEEELEDDDDEPKPVELPERFVLLADAWGSITGRMAVDYLCSRGVDRAMCAELRIGACFSGYYAGRVVVPLYDMRGELANWTARTWLPNAPKRYRYAPGGRRVLFNERALFVDTHSPVLLVEGVFDAFPYYPNAVAFGGKPTEEHFGTLLGAWRSMVVALDGDAWQESEALALRLVLAGKRADWLKLPAGRDPADKKVDPDALWEQAIALAEGE